MNFQPSAFLRNLAAIGALTIDLAHAAPGYTIDVIGNGDFRSTYATGLNNAGQVIGNVNVNPGDSSATRAFLYSNGTLQDLTPAGSDTSAAIAINNAGTVVGISGSNNGFLYVNGQAIDQGLVHPLPAAINDQQQILLSGDASLTACQGNMAAPSCIDIASPYDSTYRMQARALNNAGIAAGVVQAGPDGEGNWPAPEILLHDTSTHTNSLIGTPGGLPTGGILTVTDINDHGLLIGNVQGANSRAFVLDTAHPESIQYIDVPGGDPYTGTFATAINNNGDIVGYTVNGLTHRAFVYSQGVLTDLGGIMPTDNADTAGTLTEAVDINDAGQIAANAHLYSGPANTAALLNPVPEPQAYVLTFIGLATAAAVARRRA